MREGALAGTRLKATERRRDALALAVTRVGVARERESKSPESAHRWKRRSGAERKGKPSGDPWASAAPGFF